MPIFLLFYEYGGPTADPRVQMRTTIWEFVGPILCFS